MDKVRIAAGEDKGYIEFGAKITFKKLDLNKTHNRLKNRLLYWNEWLTIPDQEDINTKILENEYDSKVARHFGRYKTIKLIQRNFCSPCKMDSFNDYVHSYVECQDNKSDRHNKYGLLQPLDTPYAPWVSISTDFNIQLPGSRGHTQICVVLDRFTKMEYFIPLKERATASNVAKALSTTYGKYMSYHRK